MPATNPRSFQLLTVEQILAPRPLTVGPDMTVALVVQQMSQATGQTCKRSESEPSKPEPSEPEPSEPELDGRYSEPQSQASCALIVADNQLLGIFTERDLVRLIAEGTDIEAVTIAEAMTQPIITLKRSEVDSLFTVLATLKQHRIRHLPIVDEAGTLLGLVTLASIRRGLQPFNFLKLRRVGEVMSRTVIQATATATLLDLARQMTQHRVSCIVITEAKQQGSLRLLVPIGIVTERDIVQFQTLGLSLGQTLAQAVMSTPLFLLCPQDTLWTAHQEMQRRHTRRLVVANEAGGLAGIVTQTSLLQIFDPMEMLADIEQLQQLGEAQTVELGRANQQLQETNQALKTEIAERQQLELVLQAAHRSLEERFGLQAAQLVQTNEALRQERNFITAVLDTVGALVVVLDRRGHIIRFNQACEHTSGYTADEVYNREIWDVLIPPTERADIQAVFDQVKRAQEPSQHENHWLCKNGTRRLISWSNTLLKDTAGAVEYVIGTGIDVTEQRQTEQTLAQQYQQAQLLSEITRRIRESLELSEILKTAVVEARSLLDCDRVVIIQCGPGQTGQVIQEAIRPGTNAATALHQPVARLKPMADTMASVCACNDLNGECGSLQSSTFLKQWGAQACIEMAIYAGEQLWGLLTVSQCDRPRQWETFEIELLQQLANHLGVAIAQAQLLDNLEAQVEQRSEQLVQTNQQLRQEIRDRIQTEAALRQSEARLRLTTNALPVLICSVDIEQRYIFNNRTYENWYQIPLDDLRGRF
ncbi:MAG: CBS domain-containing protein, partial [Leptolyngbyaceae cyanobacterium SM2_5_2]|nr:CBS domain-containing protein [Leptolyngbyaceae cyanobacterium SM2_5_2]